MTTPRDLLIIAIDTASGASAGQGELSLALAGAELIDLLAAGAVALDDDLLVPGPQRTPDDPLLDEAARAVARDEPYESVEDWLWRRGRGLSARYLAALEAEGKVAPQRHRWIPLRLGPAKVTDSPDRKRAADRRASGEPVLAALMAAGIHGGHPDLPADLTDAPVGTVLAAVGDAVTELAAVRQRRSIEDAAFDNVWRGA